MLRMMLLPLAAAVLFGQTPPGSPEKSSAQVSQNPPPEVDAALRARVTQFYQFEINGKFNEALQMVAADTKDLFVGSSKPSYYGAEILSIRYYDDYTKAVVMSMVSRMLPIQGFMGHPLPTKMPTRWKIENGEWRYYVDPMLDMPTSPFGPSMMPPGMGVPAVGGGGRAQPPLPANLANPRSLIADKTGVQLSSSKPSSAEVAVSNPSPWPVGLNVQDPKVKGLGVKLDRTTAKPGEKAILTIQSNGAIQVPNTPVVVIVKVPQANQTIPIKVTFKN